MAGVGITLRVAKILLPLAGGCRAPCSKPFWAHGWAMMFLALPGQVYGSTKKGYYFIHQAKHSTLYMFKYPS